MAEFEFVEQEHKMEPRIKVIGVGGAGSNAVDHMLTRLSGESSRRGEAGLAILDNVEFYIINTDVQALQRAKCPNKLQIGKEITHGRGAGCDPIVGEKAALAAKDIITEMVNEADMLFITAGFGGGTGTGAAPVVAEIARELGILTIGFITRPFRFEGPQRMKRADLGLDRLREVCDTLVCISNERLLEVVGNKATLTEAFQLANEVLHEGVRSISELISIPGLINVDFGDVKTIMTGKGGAVMGVGIGKGENRSVEAVKKACSNPLLDKIVVDGAKSILMCITGGENLKLDEINQATTTVYETADSSANIILGVVLDPELKDEIKVTIIATGFHEDKTFLKKDVQTGEKHEVKASRTRSVKEQPSVTLKEKLESMLAAESDDEPEESEKTGIVDPQTMEEEQQDFVVDFNRPDNPLRRMRNESRRDALKKREIKQEEESSGESDDLETPTFLRRRKSLFD